MHLVTTPLRLLSLLGYQSRFLLLFLPALSGATRELPAATFLDRYAEGDLRVVSYNIYNSTIFTDTLAKQKFGRVVNALAPDVLNLQEVYNYSSAQVKTLMTELMPLPAGEEWHVYKHYVASNNLDDNVIVSRFPLSMTRVNTNPIMPENRGALALIDLPDDRFATDLYVMNNHLTCCNPSETPTDPAEVSRQRQADALANWMRDARTPGGFIDLPALTPMLIVGDLNIVTEPEVYDPLGTMLTGDIYFEPDFGSDFPPDWDGTSLADAHPLHNATGTDDYTWRDDGSPYDPGRLDFVLYTDSVLAVANQFVLDTTSMSDADLTLAGLQRNDIAVNVATGFYDHLPVVVDFRVKAVPTLPGDFNADGIVNAADYTVWRDGLGGDFLPAAYDIWAAQYGTSQGANSTSVPEPSSLLLTLAAMGLLSQTFKQIRESQ